MSWTDALGRPTGSIEVVGGEDAVTLLYSTREGEHEPWRCMEQIIAITRLPRNFGGEASYFRCPRCSRRTKELALGRGGFACRTCQGVVHRSSQQGPTDRARSRASRLRMRLGAEPGFQNAYGRPKHMRQTTFERIDAQIQAAEAEVLDGHIRMLGRITQRTQRSRHHPSARHAHAMSRRAFW
jgi:hypothetical protein